MNLVLKTEKLWRGLENAKLIYCNKTTVFKTFRKSKIAHLVLLKVIPISTILQVNKIKIHFILKNVNPKINFFKTTRFQKTFYAFNISF